MFVIQARVRRWLAQLPSAVRAGAVILSLGLGLDLVAHGVIPSADLALTAHLVVLTGMLCALVAPIQAAFHAHRPTNERRNR